MISFPAIAEQDESHTIETPLGAVRLTATRTNSCIPRVSLGQPLISSAARLENTISPDSTNRHQLPWEGSVFSP